MSAIALPSGVALSPGRWSFQGLYGSVRKADSPFPPSAMGMDERKANYATCGDARRRLTLLAFQQRLPKHDADPG